MKSQTAKSFVVLLGLYLSFFTAPIYAMDEYDDDEKKSTPTAKQIKQPVKEDDLELDPALQVGFFFILCGLWFNSFEAMNL